MNKNSILKGITGLNFQLNNYQLRIIVCIVLTGYTIVLATSLSERDIIQRALACNTELAVSRIALTSQALSLDQVKAKRSPQVNVSLSPYITPLDSSQTEQYSTPYGQNFRHTGIDGVIDISQYLPGGGNISLSAARSLGQSLDSTASQNETRYSISVSQPLLSGFGKNNPIDYEIAVARIDNKKASLQENKNLLETLSKIRNLFWSYYEQKMNTDIISAQLEYSRQLREMTLQRFALDEVTIIDTLSASIEELKIKKTMLMQKSALGQVRNDLANVLMLPADSLEISVQSEFTFMDIPDPDTLTNQVLTFDPQIQLFSVMRSAMDVQYGFIRNHQLPSLSAGVTLLHDNNRNSSFSNINSRSDNLIFKLIFMYALPLQKNKISSKLVSLSQESNTLYSNNWKLSLSNQVKLLIQTWKEESAKLELSDATRQVARKQFEATKEAFKLGSVGRLEMLNAQSDLSAAESEYVGGCVDMKRVEVIMQQLTGMVLPQFGIIVH